MSATTHKPQRLYTLLVKSTNVPTWQMGTKPAKVTHRPSRPRAKPRTKVAEAPPSTPSEGQICQSRVDFLCLLPPGALTSATDF